MTMPQWQIHEARSQALADSVRNYLVASHAGGIGVTFALAGSLAAGHIHPRWAIWPVLVFAVGLIFVGISMLLAQHREMHRRDAAKAGLPEPSFEKLWWSWCWNWASLLFFVAGVITGLCRLGAIADSGF